MVTERKNPYDAHDEVDSKFDEEEDGNDNNRVVVDSESNITTLSIPTLPPRTTRKHTIECDETTRFHQGDITTLSSPPSPSRSSQRCRKQPILYIPQDGPAS
jgi:hypothetical protein